MSAAVPGQVVPSLGGGQGSGRGKLDGRFGTRRTSGTETGDVFGDCSLIHVLLKREEVEAVDGFLPGAVGLWEKAYGAGSDGHRNMEWKPKETDVDLVLSGVDSGVPLYEGPAEIKRAVFRVSEKAAVLTVYVRLHGSLKGDAASCNAHLGRAADYEWQARALEGSAKTGATEGGLPFPDGGKAGKPNVGDVVLGMTDDEPGRVLSISEAGVLVVGPAEIGSDESTRELAAADVIAVHPICGPKGGKPDKALDTIAAEAAAAEVDVTFGDLVESLLALSERGTIQRHANGWPLTSDVVEDVLERARERAEAGEGEGDEGDDDLPEEA